MEERIRRDIRAQSIKVEQKEKQSKKKQIGNGLKRKTGKTLIEEDYVTKKL